jgi:hypothetical protein
VDVRGGWVRWLESAGWRVEGMLGGRWKLEGEVCVLNACFERSF